MRRWLTVALGGLVLSCQGPAAVLAGAHDDPEAVSRMGQLASTKCTVTTTMPPSTPFETVD